MTEAAHAWAAGIFCGEGCTTGNGTNSARLIVANTNRELLSRFALIMSCGRIVSKPLHEPNRKPRWEWKCDARGDVLLSLNRMWDWLTEEKREQARAIISKSTRTVFERTCRYCSRRFAPTGNSHWYCTTRCRNKARWQRDKTAGMGVV